MNPDYVIIVAGGKGARMGGDVPKQFLEIGGQPVLMRTIRRFLAFDATLNIVLVLPASEQETWQQLCRRFDFDVPMTVVDGGDTRFESVSKGLSAIPDDANGVVAVHDGVRPFVSVEVIGRCFDAAREEQAAIPTVEVVETLRRIGGDEAEKNVNRADYQVVQTPQTFDIQLLKRAYRQPYKEAFTDDATVVEQLGVKVSRVAGNRENIKVTTPFDLQVGEALCL